MNMRIKNIDRKEFIKLLSEKTGAAVSYQGAPSFDYKVGPYTITIAGSVEVDDAAADKELLMELQEKDILDVEFGVSEEERIDIGLPISQHTGTSLTNLVRILACRSEIINRALGIKDGFKINGRFLEALDEKKPVTVADFLQVLEEEGDNDINKGIEFDEDKVHFFGFPLTKNPETIKAYMDLATLINETARNKKHINMSKPDLSNEKYSFRVWLINLGMKGDRYKSAREILLKKLSGSGAFKTPEQENAFKEKMKQKREEEKECSTYHKL